MSKAKSKALNLNKKHKNNRLEYRKVYFDSESTFPASAKENSKKKRLLKEEKSAQKQNSKEQKERDKQRRKQSREKMRKRRAEERKEAKLERAKIKKEAEERALKREEALRRRSLTARAVRLSQNYGTTTLFLKGKNGVKALGAISKICRVKNVHSSDDGVSFDVPSKQRRQILALLNNLCYDYKIITNKGALPLAINLFARAGLIVGIAVMICAISIYPLMLTKVSIVPIGECDAAICLKVGEVLKASGIVANRLVGHIDSKELERELLKVDGIAYAGVKRRGTHLVVQLRQELPPDKVIGISGSQVVATKVAVVTRVVVEGGTAAVEYGDVVRIGQALIDGYVMFGDERIAVEAKGLVYGKVYAKKTVFFADTIARKSVGDVKKITKLSAFGKAPSAPDAPFENFELKVERKKLGFLLPIEFCTYEFSEILSEDVQNTLTTDEMQDIVYSQIIAEIDEPASVIAVYKDMRRADDGTYITITVECEQIISG